MSIDQATVKKVSHLARLETSEAEQKEMAVKLDGIIKWVEQLSEVDTDNVEPLANVAHIELKTREDEVNDGGDTDKVLSNAPEQVQGYYVVPKVVE